MTYPAPTTRRSTDVGATMPYFFKTKLPYRR